MRNNYYVTCESVRAGHPDKIADQIADAVLDENLRQDPDARVACEVTISKGMVHVFGEVTSKAHCNPKEIAKRVIADIGYDPEEYTYFNSITKQSPDIAKGVETGGAGDNGIIYGYATDETPEMLPLPLVIAHNLCRTADEFMKNTEEGKILRPDGKALVTFKYRDNGNKAFLDTIVLNVQHDKNTNIREVRDVVHQGIIQPIVEEYVLRNTPFKELINPTGKFAIGGPAADAGLTNRKLAVDTYGGVAHHGGGGMCGKDPTKVDRSGAYLARFLAKKVITNSMAHKCEIMIAYAIGVPEPIVIEVNCFGTEVTSEANIRNFLLEEYADILSVQGTIEAFELKKPHYNLLSRYGAFSSEILLGKLGR